MKKEIVFIVLILCLFSVSALGCQRDTAKVLTEACQQACYQAINEGQDLSNGPCLMDPMPQDNKWVCDIVHDPRQAVDNEIQNQCDAWNNGSSKHFIELTPECEFITAH